MAASHSSTSKRLAGTRMARDRLVHPVIGAADALQQPRHALRRADLDHLIDAAPVDAEIERRRRHHRAQLSVRHRRLDAAALLHLERAVMQRDRQRRLVQPPQRLEHQLRLGARVDEHDRHAGRADPRHHPGAASRPMWPAQDSSPSGSIIASSGGVAVRLLDHPFGADIVPDRRRMRHRRRQPDAAAGGRQRHQPRDAQRQLIAALGAGERVHLVHHHAGKAGEHRRRVRQRQQHRQALRRGQQDVAAA